MGTAIRPILEVKEIDLDALKGKKIAVDAFNWLYQFIASVRQYDGTPLKDSKGNITSHLSGLFNRCIFLLKNDIQPIFIFDGKAPLLKKEEQNRRAERKLKAALKLKEAIEQHDIEAMRKYSAQTGKLTDEMIQDAKMLLDGLGINWIQAPSEGEAQAAHIVKKGDAWCVASQDFDCLLFEAPRIVRNLNISRRRKKSNSFAFEGISYELINLSDNLNRLGIDLDGLIVIAMLVGTDFLPSGIKGIGPKKALEIVKKYKKEEYDKLFKEVNWLEETSIEWRIVFNTIKEMPVTDDYIIEEKPIKTELIRKILIEEHDFSEERVESSIEKLKSKIENQKQRSLSQWF